MLNSLRIKGTLVKNNLKEEMNKLRDAFLRKKATLSPSLSASPSVSYSPSPSITPSPSWSASASATVSPSHEPRDTYRDFVDWCKEEYPQIVIEYDMIKGIKL
jgi:hypothetical protein